MTVFISYGDTADQLTALRLQALGAVDPESAQKLNQAYVVRKPTIVMSDPHYAPLLQPSFGSNPIVIDPLHPDRVELGIVQHLKGINAAQNVTKALLALGTLALGLLILAPRD